MLNNYSSLSSTLSKPTRIKAPKAARIPKTPTAASAITAVRIPKAAKAARQARVPSAAAQIMVPRLLLIITTVALLVFGLVMVYSASFVEAFTDPKINSSSYFFTHQLIFVGIGLLIMGAAMVVDYRVWSTWASWIPWAVITLMLIYTLLNGNTELGGKRWIDILGFNFQPSEFAKITLILLTGTLVVQLHQTGKLKQIALMAAVAIALPIMFILIQPDLGTALIAMAGLIAVAWFGELPMKALGIGILAVVFVGAAMIMAVGFRTSRVDAWLNPFALASDEGYQIVNSFYAFAGGGVTGVGLGLSHQKYLYLPQPQNDLIFPIIGEEFGLIGTVTVVLLFLVFLYAAFRIARNAPDFYGRIIAGASAATIGFQAFLNMLCMVDLLPLTGKPLPFFSAGGSSIIVTLISVGLILNVSLRSPIPSQADINRNKLQLINGGQGKKSKVSNPVEVLDNDKLRRLTPSQSPGSQSGATPVLVGKSRYRKPGTARENGALQGQAAPGQAGRQQQGSSAARAGGRPVNPSLSLSPARQARQAGAGGGGRGPQHGAGGGRGGQGSAHGNPQSGTRGRRP